MFDRTVLGDGVRCKPQPPPERAHVAGSHTALAAEELRQRRMVDREKSRGGRNNWLLIKHHDAYEKTGANISEDDRSVASERTMEEIADGKGRKPKA